MTQEQQVFIPQVFIPRILSSATEEEVRQVFSSYAHVRSVEFMKTDNSKFNTANVYFDYWLDNPHSKVFQVQLKDPVIKTRIYYNPIFYWIIQLPDEIERNILLQQMDETAKLIPEESMEFVNSDYVEKLEFEITKLKQTQINERQKYIQRIDNLIEEACGFLNNSVELQRNLEDAAYQIKCLEQERIELQMELADTKERLQEYQ